MKLRKLTYYENKKRKIVQVELCDTFFKKTKGLMFRKNSPPLLFVFNKEKTLSIHSFFCRPFTAIWLNKNKQVTKKQKITKWVPSISGKGKYLLEIPTK